MAYVKVGIAFFRAGIPAVIRLCRIGNKILTVAGGIDRGPGRLRRGRLVGTGIGARGRHRYQGRRRQGKHRHVMPHRYPHLLVITGCTVAAPPHANHRTRGELWFLVCNSYQMLVALLRPEWF